MYIRSFCQPIGIVFFSPRPNQIPKRFSLNEKRGSFRIGRGIVCRRCTGELSAGELHSKRSLQWKDGGENTKGEK